MFDANATDNIGVLEQRRRNLLQSIADSQSEHEDHVRGLRSKLEQTNRAITKERTKLSMPIVTTVPGRSGEEYESDRQPIVIERAVPE